jgi:hypothetical protein
MRSIGKHRVTWLILAGWIFLTWESAAQGQCLPTLCGLTMVLQSDASGVTLGGSGTSAATMSLGTMQAYGGTVPTGVTRTVGTGNWTVATPFDVKVTCTNLLTFLACALTLTPNYTLTAQLQSADSINTWRIGSTTLSSASPATLTSTGTYAAATAYTFSLIIPFSESAGMISNTVNLVATAN